MTRKRRDDPPKAKPQRGVAAPGKPIHPTEPETVPEHAPEPGRQRAAPAPGVPMTAEEYERLKKEAERSPAPDQGPAHEDPPRQRESG